MLNNIVSDDKYLASYGEIIISANDWQKDDNADYPAYCNIPVEGVTTNHRADIIFATTDIEKANACGVSDFTETLAGVVRIRAVKAPEENLTAKICVTIGKEIQNAGNDE